MRRLGWLVTLSVVFVEVCPAFADADGWNYLIDKLVADGVERGRVVAAFSDPRVPPFVGLEFSPATPHEPRSLYRHFLRPATLAAAHRCRVRYAEAFEAAERAHGVSADVVAAILFIESGCGYNTGSKLVLYRLARLAMASEPANLQRNLERYTDGAGRVDPDTAAQLQARARYLEDTFYPEVRALFGVADRMGVDPLTIRGSVSGAFGAPQFLPTSYLAYGVDANGDGRVSLYDTDDAAASCARYFAGHGWRPGLSTKERRAVVWEYNHSSAYVDTVLALAARINSAPATHTKQTAKRKQQPKRRKPHNRTVQTASR
ncbi:MAG TPA: lytic murein transglycosylase [Candidatus Margulisiibacteriota bacterium]|nr:lytic murein transglycosylase [Candidatus Margulisiibacteriota bacterium]